MGVIDTGISVYDINKQGMQMYDPLDRIALGVKVSEMAKDIYARQESLKYWMLLSNENRDYTVFCFSSKNNIASFEENFIDCLQNRGDVLFIEKLLVDGNYEIWIREKDTKENKVYYFFNYIWGVVEIE